MRPHRDRGRHHRHRLAAKAERGVEAVCDQLHCRVIVRGTRRAHDPVEAVSTGPNNPVAGEPPADLLLQRRRAQLARERFVGQPTAEDGLCVIVKGCDGKMIEDHPAVPAAGAARPVIPVESIRSAANLPSEARHHRRRQISFLIGEAPLLTPERELRPTRACWLQRRRPAAPFRGRERPARQELICRPQPLHRPDPRPLSRRSLSAIRQDRHLMAKSHSFAVTGPLRVSGGTHCVGQAVPGQSEHDPDSGEACAPGPSNGGEVRRLRGGRPARRDRASAASGMSNLGIAKRLGIKLVAVTTCRNRFAAKGCRFPRQSAISQA